MKYTNKKLLADLDQVQIDLFNSAKTMVTFNDYHLAEPYLVLFLQISKFQKQILK